MRKTDIDVETLASYDEQTDLLELLIEAIKHQEIDTAAELYLLIQSKILLLIKFEAFPIQRVIEDLRVIRQHSDKQAAIIEDLLLSPCCTLTELADKNGVTKQAIHATIVKYSARYDWLDRLRQYRREIYERGLANNTKGTNGAKKNTKHMQLDMFTDYTDE